MLSTLYELLHKECPIVAEDSENQSLFDVVQIHELTVKGKKEYLLKMRKVGDQEFSDEWSKDGENWTSNSVKYESGYSYLTMTDFTQKFTAIIICAPLANKLRKISIHRLKQSRVFASISLAEECTVTKSETFCIQVGLSSEATASCLLFSPSKDLVTGHQLQAHITGDICMLL